MIYAIDSAVKQARETGIHFAGHKDIPNSVFYLQVFRRPLCP